MHIHAIVSHAQYLETVPENAQALVQAALLALSSARVGASSWWAYVNVYDKPTEHGSFVRTEGHIMNIVPI